MVQWPIGQSCGSVGLHGEMFRLRAGYFPEKESSQSSPGLRARTQGSCAVSLAVAAGAVASRRVSNHYRCRSAQ